MAYSSFSSVLDMHGRTGDWAINRIFCEAVVVKYLIKKLTKSFGNELNEILK